MKLMAPLKISFPAPGFRITSRTRQGNIPIISNASLMKFFPIKFVVDRQRSIRLLKECRQDALLFALIERLPFLIFESQEFAKCRQFLFSGFRKIDNIQHMIADMNRLGFFYHGLYFHLSQRFEGGAWRIDIFFIQHYLKTVDGSLTIRLSINITIQLYNFL